MAKFPTFWVAGAALLVASCVSQQTHNEALDKNAELEQQYQQLNQAMTSEVAGKNMHITRLQDAIKVSVHSELLFPSGGWDMPEAGKRTIAKMAAVLAPHQTSKIAVNGYTDTTPIGPGLMKQGVTSNLILSEKRADTVMQYMISQGVKPNLVSAHGFGEASPAAPNDTAEGRAQNRRVELTIVGTAK
jgi:chemotaxis protein MotB